MWRSLVATKGVCYNKKAVRGVPGVKDSERGVCVAPPSSSNSCLGWQNLPRIYIFQWILSSRLFVMGMPIVWSGYSQHFNIVVVCPDCDFELFILSYYDVNHV